MPAMRAPVHRAGAGWCLQPRLPKLAGLALLALSGLPADVGAFGPSGHRIAGQLAENYLCAETRTALAPLLQGSSLAEAGEWPDRIRNRPGWEHARPWHYINVDDGASVDRAARRSPDNVLAALARFEADLADRSQGPDERRIALRFVAHLVADIHQPLHVGREADRGGNLVRVLVAGEEIPLHRLWDGEALLGDVRPAGLTHPGVRRVRRWQRAEPLDWAVESLALRSRVYAFTHGTDAVLLREKYLHAARSTLEERLQQAGVRLAGRLNTILGPAGGCREVASQRPNL